VTGLLQGKVAVITGAAGGLGQAIARAFAAEGARLALCDVNRDALDSLTRDFGPDCLGLACDITSSAAVDDMFDQVARRFGGVQILVNNAAIIPIRARDEERRLAHYTYLTQPQPRRSLGFTSAMTDEDWHRFWDVNVHGLFYCTRAALKLMEPERQGKIINIASIAGMSSFSAHSPHYSATKGAVIAFTRSVAAEVAGANIFVNAIAPGGVHTEQFEGFLQAIGEEQRNRFFQLVPLGRLGKPEEYASLAVYLAGDGHYLVGQIISPNGGMF